MFSEGTRFIQDTNEVIKMFREEKDGEFLMSVESRTKTENAGAVIDQLLMYFDGMT